MQVISVLLAARLSRLSPPSPGHAAARSLTRAWTRRPQPRAGSYEEDGEEQGTSEPSWLEEQSASLSHLSHRLSGQDGGLPHLALDTQRTLTCAYGLPANCLDTLH